MEIVNRSVVEKKKNEKKNERSPLLKIWKYRAKSFSCKVDKPALGAESQDKGGLGAVASLTTPNHVVLPSCGER